MERISLKPLFYSSARQGIVFGILFSLMSACLLAAAFVPGMNLLFILLAMATLFYLPASLSAIVAPQSSYCTFPALWMSCIIQFTCGALICALLTAAFLVIISPGFLSHYVKTLLEQFNAMQPESTLDTSTIVTPSPMQFVGSLFWATSFFGSMTGLIMGMILPRSSFFKRLISRQQSKLINS